MNGRFVVKYYDNEEYTIETRGQPVISTVSEEDAIDVCELLNRYEYIIKLQEMELCSLNNNMTAIREWGVKAPCFNEKGEYVDEEVKK